MNAQRRSILDMNAFEGVAEPSAGDPPRPPAPTGRDAGAGKASLLDRRLANMGPASILFYHRPIELRRASGAWLEAIDGTRYLDCYNNVPSVGHCHPRVVEAVSRQFAELNINSRYLSEATESYVERLRATFPAPLAHAVLTCSGSEANDLALRMAAKATGNRGFIVTEAAYHGNTAAVADISPSSWKAAKASPAHVRLISAPSAEVYGEDVAMGFAAAVAGAARSLQESGHGLAAFICDSIFSSDGVHSHPIGLLKPAVEAAHAGGGIYIADEVQPGFGRLGHGLWGFERHGVVPDVVSMGKPMGNGFPMAGIVARRELLDSFCVDTGYFHTVGGSPVAAAAGAAVLDCIEDEGLIDNARRVGALLRDGIGALSAESGCIREVRGAGLFIGVEFAQTGVTPAEGVVRLINAMQRRGVLIGAAGRFGEALKLRPPLCLSEAEASFFLDAMRQALRELV